MPKTKLNVIKPFLAINDLPDGDVLHRLTSVHDGMLNNPAYPTPPVDMPTFKTVIDAYNTAAAAAQHDGGKNAVTQRDKLRAEAIGMYRLLGHYVETASKNDMNTFVSSGFQAASKGQKTPPQPVETPIIVSVDQGNTGQFLVTFKRILHALHYEVRYAGPPAAGAADPNWSTTVVPSWKPPAVINNLTPGTRYTVQVRAYGKLGYSGWSASVQRMAI
jgi:Fibronectin type III domain